MACRLTKKGIKPCKGLSSVLQSFAAQGSRQQGVSMHTMVDMKTMKFSRNLVILKSGEHGKKGVVFNVCPFCTAPLLKDEAA